MQFIFTTHTQKEFLKLEKGTQTMIIKKLQKIKNGDGYIIKPLVNMNPYTHRLRIENYRLLLAKCEEGYEVLSIGHRSTIYQ